MHSDFGMHQLLKDGSHMIMANLECPRPNCQGSLSAAVLKKTRCYDSVVSTTVATGGEVSGAKLGEHQAISGWKAL